MQGRLRDIQTAADALTKRWLKEYIWQRESFKLTSHGNTLQGRTNFGDSIADEWLIVYLLRELSKQFPDAWIRVTDSDGEFLLIEAAKVLPKWLGPEVAENRVWINNGHVKIIPLVPNDDPPKGLTMEEAIATMRNSPSTLLDSPEINKEAFHRLTPYPAAIATSMHHARVTIPRRLAYILHDNPSCISPAIEAFYLRDPISTKPLNTKDLASLTFSPEDFVTVSVRFTRVGYAQVHSQEYSPPPSWTAVLPHIGKPKVAMGMKLACGFEMLVQDAQNADKRAVRGIQLLLSELDEGEATLPTDAEIKTWDNRQDDEKWLDIDFADFEKELSGKGRPQTKPQESSTEEHVHKLVSRFESFMADEKAGIDGVEDSSDEDDPSTGTSSPSSSGEEKGQSFSEAEFEQAMREMMGMPQLEKDGLMDEARQLAHDLEEGDEEGERDEDEETRLVMEMMEKELKRRRALDVQEPKANMKPK